jgi:hypothetical protein
MFSVKEPLSDLYRGAAWIGHRLPRTRPSYKVELDRSGGDTTDPG